MPDCGRSGQSPTRPPTQPDVPTLSAYATARGDPLLRAYTAKTTISQKDFVGWGLVAQAGDLSPTSRTSGIWDRQWPIRPDVVFEGGNQAHDGINEPEAIDDLQLLTTHHRPTQHLLTTFGETSSASALAARMAARIMAARPGLWPETVRGLIVHAAEWTRIMRRHVEQGASQTQKSGMLRRYGWGVNGGSKPGRRGGVKTVSFLIHATTPQHGPHTGSQSTHKEFNGIVAYP